MKTFKRICAVVLLVFVIIVVDYCIYTANSLLAVSEVMRG